MRADIYIVHKPTDTEGDNSTAMVTRELDMKGECWHPLSLAEIDLFRNRIEQAVIWVCGMEQENHQFEVLQTLAARNRVVNTPEAIATCASKALTTALLVRENIRTPETFFSASRRDAAVFIRLQGKVVYKPVYGFDGNGVRLITSEDQLEDGPYYLQEYVPNDRDFRVFVIGDEAVGAIERRSDHLTHNIHQGGTAKAVPVDPEMASIAIAATEAVNADYAGVDLLLDQDGYTVLEVNGTPNWHGMTAPIPVLIADHLVSAARLTRR
ncbi:alpha-L-glutamate ligase, RimK family [Methanosphaerula palustris E1-9c]|uniref:Alpha-L-glutamate ligase, RimK family n=2 Tax=Methanosphaerula palustris TaxID=475088 RepID=B8GEE4_METPE|nr:alpha-L-glutamate ligase, RimK family [Methanosphaerula palustris E1-9c]